MQRAAAWISDSCRRTNDIGNREVSAKLRHRPISTLRLKLAIAAVFSFTNCAEQWRPK
jgi:hypothetical protein